MRLNPIFQPFTSRGLGLEGLFGLADEPFAQPSSTRVRRTDEGLEFQMLLPGVAPEDLELEVEGRWLTVRAKSALWSEESDGEAPTIQRRFQLPFPVDGEAAVAELVHGVLTLALPRPASDAPRRITVRTSPRAIGESSEAKVTDAEVVGR